ncbi:hypothetical protein MTO96_034576 [Rhipicephalus appendiculatus]
MTNPDAWWDIVQGPCSTPVSGAVFSVVLQPTVREPFKTNAAKGRLGKLKAKSENVGGTGRLRCSPIKSARTTTQRRLVWRGVSDGDSKHLRTSCKTLADTMKKTKNTLSDDDRVCFCECASSFGGMCPPCAGLGPSQGNRKPGLGWTGRARSGA